VFSRVAKKFRVEAEDIISGQVVGWIVRILIRHLTGKNRYGARLIESEIKIRIEREAYWAATDGGRMSPGVRAGNLEPVAADVYRLIEIDRDV
jgi:hypothetical protein